MLLQLEILKAAPRPKSMALITYISNALPRDSIYIVLFFRSLFFFFFLFSSQNSKVIFYVSERVRCMLSIVIYLNAIQLSFGR